MDNPTGLAVDATGALRRRTAAGTLVLAAGLGLVLIHQRDLTMAGIDPYLSAVPVLLAAAVGMLALGAHRWILRAVAALSARTRAATPLLAAARAARASPVAGVALVVLVLAVTTGAFAATVNGAVAEARDQQAVREVGAHARVTGDSPARVPLTLLWPPAPDLAGAASAVMSVSGVTDVAAVRRDGELRSGGRLVQGVEVVAIDAPAYQRLLVALGVEQRLAVEIIEAGPDTDPLPVLAPPSIGVRPEVTVRLDGEQRPVVVVGDVAGLPGPDRDRLWVLVPRQALAAPGPADELLVAGAGVDAEAVRAAASAAVTGTDPAGAVSGLAVISLDEHRAALERAGFHRGISQLLLTGGLAGWVAALVAIVLLLVTPASERARFLALVRAIGLSTGQARRVVAAELAPVIAVAGGVGVGLGTLLPVMVAPALGLGGFTGGTPPHYTLDVTWSGLMAGSMLGLAAAAVLLISIGEPSTDLRSSGHMTSESRQGRHGTSPRRRRIAGARRDRKEATAVRREDQERFRQFVTERTPELFGVAFDLAGRQDAAERQLQGALERLALRWRRERDPFRFTVVAMRRRSLPWWRRWLGVRGTDPAVEPPTAARGRPVDVGDLGLAGARRRRWGRIAGAVAAAGVVAAAVVVPGRFGGFGDGAGSVDADVDYSGMSVVTAFYHQGWQVLDPETGDYHRRLQEPGLVSPDLRTMARLAGNALVFESTTGDDRAVQANLPFEVSGQFAWAHDSSAVVLAPFAIGVGASGQFFRRVAIVEAGTGAVSVVDLSFPEGYGGWWGLGAFWTVDGHLAVPTIDAFAGEVPPLPGSGSEAGLPLIEAVTIFDPAGNLVAELPLRTQDLDGDEPHAGLVWLPARQLPDGRFLLFRRPGPAVVELAASTLATADRPYAAVGLELARQVVAGVETTLSAWPAGVLPDGRVLVQAGFTLPGLAGVTTSQQTLVFDLDAGSATDCGLPCDAARVAAMLGVELPVPDAAEHLRFGDATALAPQAGRAAF
jgi:hypothetical protein